MLVVVEQSGGVAELLSLQSPNKAVEAGPSVLSVVETKWRSGRGPHLRNICVQTHIVPKLEKKGVKEPQSKWGTG